MTWQAAANAPPDEGKRVVVIDDDEVMLRGCEAILGRMGFAVEAFDNGASGLERLAEWRPPLLVVDLKMPGLDGFEVIRRVRECAPDTVIIVITGYATVATAVDAMKAGAYDFLPKPFTPDELRLIVRRGLERWRLAEESRRLHHEKRDAERRFSLFVSHQLKTPVVAVKQYLDILVYTSRGSLPEGALTWIRRSQTRLSEMLAIIQDWLELSGVERGELCRRDEVTALSDVAARVVSALQPGADDGGVTLDVQMPPGLPALRGDSTSVGTLVQNLVSNAIKYNRRGGAVHVHAEDAGDAVSFVVSDTGIGIPAASLSRIYDEFYRVKCEATRDVPGTGLGLSICRRIVAELRGTIDVESVEGEGTTFRLLLPAAARAQAQADGSP